MRGVGAPPHVSRRLLSPCEHVSQGQIDRQPGRQRHARPEPRTTVVVPGRSCSATHTCAPPRLWIGMRARSRSEASHASTCVATSATTASDWRAGGRMHVSSGCGPAASASPSRRTRARSGPAREPPGRAGSERAVNFARLRGSTSEEAGRQGRGLLASCGTTPVGPRDIHSHLNV